MTPNGVCETCANLNSPMFALPPSLQKAKDQVTNRVNEVAAPATSILNVVLIGGVTAGVITAVAYGYRKLRNKNGA